MTVVLQKKYGGTSMFEPIKSSVNWIEITPVHKGWSQDQKYHIITISNQELLLRVSSIETLEEKQLQFDFLKKIEELNVNAPKAFELGHLNDHQIYMILSWVEGEDLSTAIEKFSDEEQYLLGIQTGEMLKKIHSVKIDQKHYFNWFEFYQRKVNKKIKMIEECEITLPKRDFVISYVKKHMHLVKNRPIKLQHGDFHIGNMVIKDGRVGIVDFGKLDFADPYDDFKPYCWTAFQSPYFESGMIDGYFEHNVPEDFFPILALYSAESLMGHLPWAVTFGDREIQMALKVASSSFDWFNDYKDVVPSFYQQPHKKSGV